MNPSIFDVSVFQKTFFISFRIKFYLFIETKLVACTKLWDTIKRREKKDVSDGSFMINHNQSIMLNKKISKKRSFKKIHIVTISTKKCRIAQHIHTQKANTRSVLLETDYWIVSTCLGCADSELEP